ALDNVASPRELLLEVQITSARDGAVLLCDEHRLQLEPGERRRVTTLDLRGFERQQALLTTRLEGFTSTRVLGEPKDVQLSCPPLRASYRDGVLGLESERP